MMTFSKPNLCALALVVSFVMAPLGVATSQNAKPIKDANAVTLQQLLDQVRQGRVKDNAAFNKREADFRKNRNQQKSVLTRTQNRIKREEARSERLEKRFSENELKLAQ
jgi:biopolymer transport protein ExbB